MAIHDDVLRAARRLCRERGEWTFSAEDIVRALPHLNEHSVRAHISSRCCVNAPPNHPHRWPYFRRVARGSYEFLPRHRAEPNPPRPLERARGGAERAVRCGRVRGRPPRDTIHAVLRRYEGVCVAEWLGGTAGTPGRPAGEV